jgi:hypothetical protein
MTTLQLLSMSVYLPSALYNNDFGMAWFMQQDSKAGVHQTKQTIFAGVFCL